MAGRRVLVRSVLSALPTFAMTVLKVPEKIIREMDKARRRFLWCQDDQLAGGKCKVAWSKVCSPVRIGGLGIIDLNKFSTALRLRWQWIAWDQPARPWVQLQPPVTEKDRQIFSLATKVQIRNVRKANFWKDNWLGDSPLAISYPTVYNHARRISRSVEASLRNDRWIKDLQHGDTMAIAPDFLPMWRMLQAENTVLRPEEDNRI